jgi:hypothetical protein
MGDSGVLEEEPEEDEDGLGGCKFFLLISFVIRYG